MRNFHAEAVRIWPLNGTCRAGPRHSLLAAGVWLLRLLTARSSEGLARRLRTGFHPLGWIPGRPTALSSRVLHQSARPLSAAYAAHSKSRRTPQSAT